PRYLLFFFSSRRRHTRSYGDWSSDVCSSDLPPGGVGVEPAGDVDRLELAGGDAAVRRAQALEEVPVPEVRCPLVVPLGVAEEQVADLGGEDLFGLGQVGRVGRHQLVEGVEDRLRGVPTRVGL